MKRVLSFVAVAAAAGSLFVAAPAWAQNPSPSPAPGPLEAGTVDADATPPALPRIAPRSAQAFAESARGLDPALAQAVERDLKLSPAQYLADAAAAQDAGALVSALRERTGAPVSAQVDGATVTVYAADARTADLARQAGAAAVVGAAPQHPVPDVPLHPRSDVYGGQPYFIGTQPSGSGSRCSAAFPGYAESNGAPQLLSAGHCYVSGTSTYEINATGPMAPGSAVAVGSALGSWLPAAVQFGNGGDSSLMALTAGHTVQPKVLTWGGGTGAPLASAPQKVTGVGPGVVGAPLCKSGGTTGWTCGHITNVDYQVEVQDDNGTHTVNAIIADTCSDHGDSGGAAVSGTTAVGLVSAGPDGLACGADGNFTAFYPMVSAAGASSVMSHYSSSWEPAISVTATVAVTSPSGTGRVLQGGVISGTASGASAGTYVKLKLANESTARTASIVNGAWSISLAGAPSGSTTYTVSAASGRYSTGAAVSGSVQIVPMATQRVAGADRFDTSVAIAKQAYPTTASTVYVATGLSYPDALSAAPAAAKENAPLLLTGPTLPASVREEIASLHPDHIVIVGGVNAVPTAVQTALGKLAGDVQRVAGSDRFETSRKLAVRAFGSTIGSAFVATGIDFPDALAAGAAAGSKGQPVLLVNGQAGGVDAATASFLRASKTTTVTVVGGTTAVSPGVQKALADSGIAVTRYAGSDRFETAEVVGRLSFTSYTQAYVASGLGFPDALAGSALAATKHVPLFTVNGWCVPRSVVGDLAKQNVQKVWLLGGTNALSRAIDTLNPC